MGGKVGTAGLMAGTGGAAAGYLGAKRLGDIQKNRFEADLNELRPGERPNAPVFSNLLNAQGQLADQYRLKDSSAWQKAMGEKQAQEELGARDLAQSLAQTQAAQTRSQLASRAGLRSGAAERAAQVAGKTAAEQQQAATRQGALARTGIGVQGEEMNREAERFNIGNTLNEFQRQDALKQQRYSDEMGQWAAQNQAYQTMKAGRGKGQSGGAVGGVAKVTGK